MTRGVRTNRGFSLLELLIVVSIVLLVTTIAVPNVVVALSNGRMRASTPFAPFPGFQAFPFYPGYSADFFDGRHFVMKGASPRTAAALLRPSFRNWFQPLYPNIYATFRCVEN